jgi:hydrogenase nickel incorporation protein HypA/HybF
LPQRGIERENQMHELSIVEEIIATVQDEMARRDCTRIEEINVRIGALSGLDPEALAFSFEAATADSPFSDTKLTIERTAARGKCRQCDMEFSINDLVFLCPFCSSQDIEIIQGEELHVQYLVKA